MSEARSHIACPKCGIQLNDYERRHRAVWQWALFPNSRSYQCEHCGKKTFIFNSNKYLAKNPSAPTGLEAEPRLASETASEQGIESKVFTPKKEPDSRQKSQHYPPDTLSPFKASGSLHTAEDTQKEKSFITSINTFWSASTALETSLVDNKAAAQEDQIGPVNPAPTKNTSQCQKVHALLNFPNQYVDYQNTLTIEDEIEDAKKIHQELQDSISWSLDNFKNSQHLKLGLIRESTRKLVECILRNSDALFLLSRLRDSSSHASTDCIDAAILAALFGRHMGLTKQELNTLALGVLLRDIGKSKVPSAVIKKQSTLAPAEIKLIQKHVQFSLNILSTADGVDTEILAIIESHHERFDGKGYPQNRPEAEVSVFAKMASIVDAYDAMTHNRPYRKALPVRKAMNVLHQQRGRRYQPELVDEFAYCLGDYPTGSMVVLNTGQAGIVISQNEISRLQPKVLIFRDGVGDDGVGDNVITPFTCDLEKESTGEGGESVFIKAA